MKRSSSFLGGAFVSIVMLAGISLLRPNDPIAPIASATSVPKAAATVPGTGNLIANPSLELNTNGQPSSWLPGSWGSNKTVFTYNTALGHTGTHSTSITVTKYKNGDAKWYPQAVAAQSNAKYTYSDWYESNVTTEVDAVEVNNNGVVNYVWLGNLTASSTWKQANFTFTTMANLKTVTFYQIGRASCRERV